MQGMKQSRVTSRVMIVLSQYRITGNVHLHPGQRLSDYVNGVKDFIPVTKAKVIKVDNEEEINHMRLLEVNVRHILLVYPLEGQELPSESDGFEEAPETEVKPDDLESLKTVYVDPFKKKN